MAVRFYRMMRLGTAIALAVLVARLPARADEKTKDTGSIQFARDIRPILSKHCFACHGPDETQRKGKLRLDLSEGAFADHDGRKAVVPGKPGESELLERITADDDETRMPPSKSGKKLDPEQIAMLQKWIESGAKWETHWSFKPIVRPAKPEIIHAEWPENEIDRFVLARLEREGLRPSARADRYTLIRRVSLDLTGLPPTPADADAFVTDTRPDAFERVVDRLLACPSYGERFARVWLDLARYADTKGYEKDLTRTIWPYRDWVIAAFNRDLPFDQFTIEQLAGDLLPNSTVEQRIATAFHRNTMSNDEGGTDDEEFRIAAVKDRVDTTAQVWLGLTMGCAKCHTHKYDPVSQREYYRFYAFFNQTEDSDRSDDHPLLPSPTRDQEQQLGRLGTELKRLRDELKRPTPEIREAAAKWESSLGQGANWTSPKPSVMEAESKATLTLRDDGSIFIPGVGPEADAYRITLPIDIPAVSAIRVESLPDAGLPKGGAGRSRDDGNFVLSRIRATLKRADGEVIEIPLTRAEADFSQEQFPVADAIKNSDLTKHGWAIAPRVGQRHAAIFATDRPISAGRGSSLTIELDHRYRLNYPGFSFGRFRLSATAEPSPKLPAIVPDPVASVLKIPDAERSNDQKQAVLDYFASIAPETKSVRDRIAAIESETKAIPIAQTPIFRELPKERRRTTQIHVRGNFLEKGEVVTAAIPSAFPPLPEGASEDRLGVARWLVDPRNLLTARVMANRFWAQFFGTGLVKTQEDFGSQGLPPSHPELLDWLACEFRDGGWSMKRLCKMIVMSATYQQSARVTPELRSRDRFNRLLARGPRFRLEAEMVRDEALAVSGLLSAKLCGPSVMPPQPPGIWQTTYNNDKWVTSPGEDKHRRGLYTFLKRTSPYPSMTTFDAPSREVCTVRRISTNTPLQALVTLNDPVYVEASQALARRAVCEGGAGLEGRIERAFRLTLTRPPAGRELEQLSALYRRRLTYYQAHVDAAEAMACSEVGAAPAGTDRAELAAMTAICNVLLNLDEFLSRG
ncbi:MAG: type protein [Planctomycetota bacterium]|nr:type protein [Planctomycetota bacterium]